jgi:hypothetical protein
MKSTRTDKTGGSATSRDVDANCTVRLDRLILNAVARDKKGILNVPGYKRLNDFMPRRQGKMAVYDRVSRLRSTTNTSEIAISYKRRVPWVAPQRVTLIADDETGLKPEEIEGVTSQCLTHSLSLVELALDFTPESGVDRKFVVRHGQFGKSRRRSDRGGPDLLRYGGRACPKLVRAYHKEPLNCFRVEIEVHRSLLRKQGLEKVSDLGTVAIRLVPAHAQFVTFRWAKLEAYLNRKLGREGAGVYEEARRQADLSLRAARTYLAKKGVTNPHRFLGPLRINRDIKAALRRWAERFSLDQWD